MDADTLEELGEAGLSHYRVRLQQTPRVAGNDTVDEEGYFG